MQLQQVDSHTQGAFTCSKPPINTIMSVWRGQTGSRSGCLKKGEAGIPLRTLHFHIFSKIQTAIYYTSSYLSSGQS